VSSYLERATPGRVLDVEFDAEPSAAAAIQRITVRDAVTGQVLTTPERGSQFTIDMAVEVREAIPGLNVSIELIDEQGVKIIDDTARDRPTGGALSPEPGVYVVTATIPPMLRAGTYMVRGWIGNEFEDSFYRDLLAIRVAPRADDPQEFMERLRAVQPEIDWKVRREPLA
jgi:hypothetical protein